MRSSANAVKKGATERGMAVLEAPSPEYAPDTAAPVRGKKKPARSDGSMRREFAEYEDDFDDLPRPRRRQAGVKLRVRGGLPKSWGGRAGIAAAVLLMIGLCVATVLVAKEAVLRDDRFMIPSSSHIEVEGNQHVTRAQLLSIFGEDVERNIFRVPLEQRRGELEQLPWVEHATVMRLLPNRLRISILERKPVAFVRQGNHIGLVDANGVLLDMPTDVQANMQYSFPVVIGLKPGDPISLRAARMKLYQKFIADLDLSGERISEKLSEVDLSDPEDVRAMVADKGGEVMVHFGEDNFLERYRRFEEHLPEWRTQYPHLSSVDMRYNRQVVLEMQKGTSAPAPSGEAVAPVVPAHELTPPPGQTSAPRAATAPATKAAAAKPSSAKPVAKPAAKVPAKKTAARPAAKTPVKKTTTTATAGQQRQSSVAQESFWVHPKKGTAERKGTTESGKGTMSAEPAGEPEPQFHPPQVIHR